MGAFQEPGAESIQILPLVIVTQAFPARPSALPDVRDFVRRRLARTPLVDGDIRKLCDRVANVLLDAAGEGGTIQVSLRTFPTYAEVDVLFSQTGDEYPYPGDEADRAQGIGAGFRADDDRRRGQSSPTGRGTGVAGPALHESTPTAPTPEYGAAAVGARPAGTTFAGWLSAALRREGLTMEAASRRLDVSAKTVSRWISGTTEPRLRDLSRIRDEFGDPPFP